MIESVKDVIELVGDGVKVIKYIAAPETFRKYSRLGPHRCGHLEGQYLCRCVSPKFVPLPVGGWLCSFTLGRC